MAQYNFKGDIEGISEGQLKFINSVILDLGYQNSKVTFTPVGKAGDNYVAVVKRITIEGENGNLNLIAKIAPTNEAHRAAMFSFIMFNNEHIMYSEVLPKLVQLQKDADVPEEEQLRYAKCYGSTAEQPQEVILLEDLNQSDFLMLDRFQPLPNDCIYSVLKNFAKIHSLSYVLKQYEPETYNDFKTKLIDMSTIQAGIPEMKLFFEHLEEEVLSALDNHEQISLVKHKVVNTMVVYKKLAKADKDNRFTVILQGDPWTNNIMFKSKDNKTESIMIDYQLSKNASPVCDLMYMIFNCTDHESRSKHFYDWIDYYHSELDKSLSNFNLKANYVYPRDKLDADLKRYGKHMFGVAVMLASILIRKSDDAAKVLEAMKGDNSNLAEQIEGFGISQLDEESVTRFRNRIVGLINSYTEFGLL